MGFIDEFRSRRSRFQLALGRQRDFESWWVVAENWIAAHPVDFSKISVLQAIDAYTNAAKVGLMIDGVECMVMTRGKKIQVEIGAAGVIRKAGAAGIAISTGVIKEGDRIELDEGMGTVSHTPAWLMGQEPGKTLGYYARAQYRDGRTVVRALSAEEAKKRATTSGAWKDWPDEMGRKSAILSLRKVLYFGDEIDDIVKAADAAESWDDTASTTDDPRQPPESLEDRVATEAARQQQDADAEAPQDLPL